MTMPQQKPGKSEQVVCTPPEFLSSVRDRLCIREFAIDLAASHGNAVCELYLTEEMDSLVQAWSSWNRPRDRQWMWLNPPFADIRPWAEKCWLESRKGARLHMAMERQGAKLTPRQQIEQEGK